MSSKIQLQTVDGIAIFRLTGSWTFPQAVQACDQAIAQAVRLHVPGLLLVANGMTGFEAPTMAERHGMVRRWAHTADGRIVVAMVTLPSFIDPEKFAVVAAANFGLLSNVFACEREAEQWLRTTLVPAPVSSANAGSCLLRHSVTL